MSEDIIYVASMPINGFMGEIGVKNMKRYGWDGIKAENGQITFIKHVDPYVDLTIKRIKETKTLEDLEGIKKTVITLWYAHVAAVDRRGIDVAEKRFEAVRTREEEIKGEIKEKLIKEAKSLEKIVKDKIDVLGVWERSTPHGWAGGYQKGAKVMGLKRDIEKISARIAEIYAMYRYETRK